MKSLYNIARVILVLDIGFQTKIFLNSKNVLSNCENVLSNIISFNFLFTIILDDFNDRLLVQWTRDKTTIDGTQLESLTTVHGLYRLISQLTNLLPQTASCTDLILLINQI